MNRIETYSVPQLDVPFKLNQNESHLDIPIYLKDKILNRFRECRWNLYPKQSSERIINLLSGYTGMDGECLLYGNGSNELIQATLLCFRSAIDEVVIVDPSFSIYERTAEIIGIKVKKIPLVDNFSFDIEAILNSISERTLLIIDSPNNPTGSVLEIPLIEEVLKLSKGHVVIDEAYFEFNGVSAADLLRRYTNLIILRTFSKAIRLAGLRFGYMLCSPDLRIEIEKCRLPFSVSSFTQLCVEIILVNIEQITHACNDLSRQRDRLFNRLIEINGVMPYPSRANFVLAEFEGKPGNTVYEELLDKGILVRSFSHPRLENKLRITVGSEEANNALLNALSEIMGETG